MCQLPIPICSLPWRRHFQQSGPPRRRNPSNLFDPPLTPCDKFTVAGGIWNCQSASRKDDFITVYAPPSFPHSSSPSPWPRSHLKTLPLPLSSGRSGGTGLFISPSWTFSVFSLINLSLSTFEYHCLNYPPHNLYIVVVVYHASGSLGSFYDELDTLLSSFPEYSTLLILLGDFNIHRQRSHFLALLHSFDLSLQPSPPTQKAANLLDLIFLRNCLSSNPTFTPSTYIWSPLNFLSIPLALPPPSSPPTRTVTVRRNLHSLLPSSLTSRVTASLPPLEYFNLPTDSAYSTVPDKSLVTWVQIDLKCPLKYISNQYFFTRNG